MAPRTRRLAVHDGGNSKFFFGMVKVWPSRLPTSGPLLPARAFPLPPPATPNNNQKQGPLPSLKPHSLWPPGLRPFFHKEPPLSISVSQACGGLDREMLTLRRLKVLVPSLHLTNGLPRGEELLLFFPGLRREACQKDVEASGPPAAPRRVADRR